MLFLSYYWNTPNTYISDFDHFRDFRDPIDESLEKKKRKQIKETIKGD